MTATNDFNDAAFIFKLTGSGQELPVVNFSASEWISLPYSFTVAIATTAELGNADQMIGSEALLTIVNSVPVTDGSDRYFHGVIRRIEHTGMNGRDFLYEVEVIPALFLLSLRKNCRIFQKKNTQEIVKTVLEEAGITSNGYRFALANTDRLRGFCVQYQESDFEFISRLMEEEGIYYFFEHYIDKHVMVICDNKAVHIPIQGNSSVTCNSGDGLVAEEESICHFTFSQRQISDSFTHSNFNFKKPGLDLTTTSKVAGQQQHHIYEYPSPHTSQARGGSLAKVRQEHHVAFQKQGHGCSSSCRLTPGFQFTLVDHHCDCLNADYLIIEVSHTGSQNQALKERSTGSASYENQFTVIPAETQYRPPIKMIKPFLKGPQTALVVGPQGEEIHTDEFGRIKVKFHWDHLGLRDDKSSCWIRVAQVWGGSARGAQFIPRVGDEVLVDFLEGDPDRPIVTGCVFNGDNPPIINPETNLTQSGFKTKTHKGNGFNELRFDDKAGGEEIYIHAEKDFNIVVNGNENKSIGNSLINRADSTATVEAGEQLCLVCGNASIVLDQSGTVIIHGSEIVIAGIGTVSLQGNPVQMN